MTISAISIMFYILLHICFVTQDVVCQDCSLCCYCLEKLVNCVFPLIDVWLPQNGGQNLFNFFVVIFGAQFLFISLFWLAVVFPFISDFRLTALSSAYRWVFVQVLHSSLAGCSTAQCVLISVSCKTNDPLQGVWFSLTSVSWKTNDPLQGVWFSLTSVSWKTNDPLQGVWFSLTSVSWKTTGPHHGMWFSLLSVVREIVHSTSVSCKTDGPLRWVWISLTIVSCKSNGQLHWVWISLTIVSCKSHGQLHWVWISLTIVSCKSNGQLHWVWISLTIVSCKSHGQLHWVWISLTIASCKRNDPLHWVWFSLPPRCRTDWAPCPWMTATTARVRSCAACRQAAPVTTWWPASRALDTVCWAASPPSPRRPSRAPVMRDLGWGFFFFFRVGWLCSVPEFEAGWCEQEGHVQVLQWSLTASSNNNSSVYEGQNLVRRD